VPRSVIRSTLSRLEVQVGNGSARTGHLLVSVELLAGCRAAVGQQVLCAQGMIPRSAGMKEAQGERFSPRGIFRHLA